MVQSNAVPFGSMLVHSQVVRHWLVVGSVAAGAACAVAVGVVAWIRHRRPTAEQLEERRRQRLAEIGRIVDGVLTDAEPAESAARTIIYTYRIAGVTYECSQDVSMLGDRVKNLRLDYPVQVRYSRENPADSIVVAETWNGLWFRRVEDGSGELKT
jgi:hypothetical protein